MRPLASLSILALLAVSARAADVAAPVVRAPSAGPTLSAPVLATVDFQLRQLGRIRTAGAERIASQLALMAGPGAQAGRLTPDAAAAILIERAMTDTMAYKSLFQSLHEAGGRSADSLIDLRDFVYSGTSPDKVQAAFRKTMGPLESRLSSGRPLGFGDLAAAFDGSAPATTAPSVLASGVSRPGENGKIDVGLTKGTLDTDIDRRALGFYEPPPLAESRRKAAGVVMDDEQEASPAAKRALDEAIARVGPMPSGVKLVVRNARMWGDNPQIVITVDGRQAYWEYLYHAESSLARLRLRWNEPKTWLALWKARTPSADLSQRFEAALRLAQETGAGSAKLDELFTFKRDGRDLYLRLDRVGGRPQLAFGEPGRMRSVPILSIQRGSMDGLDTFIYKTSKGTLKRWVRWIGRPGLKSGWWEPSDGGFVLLESVNAPAPELLKQLEPASGRVAR